jgi:hypothetical protein
MNEIDVIKNLDLAMVNSYKLLTGKNTFDELVVDRLRFYNRILFRHR